MHYHTYSLLHYFETRDSTSNDINKMNEFLYFSIGGEMGCGNSRFNSNFTKWSFSYPIRRPTTLNTEADVLNWLQQRSVPTDHEHLSDFTGYKNICCSAARKSTCRLLKWAEATHVPTRDKRRKKPIQQLSCGHCLSTTTQTEGSVLLCCRMSGAQLFVSKLSRAVRYLLCLQPEAERQRFLWIHGDNWIPSYTEKM